MKSIYFLSILMLSAFTTNAYAVSSKLNVVCKGDDVGAEVSVNGKFKGECPLEIKVPMGKLKLKVQKNERIFEQEINVGNNTTKTVEANLITPVFHTPSKESQPEQSKSAKRDNKGNIVSNKPCSFCPEMVPIPGADFEIGKYTVTFEEWDACVADGGCNGYVPLDEEWGRGKQPVVNVSWNDIQYYLEWLSVKTGKTYRLPSEHEMEIATRAGTLTQYYWGDDLGFHNANCRGCGNRYEKKRNIPMPVGSFKPNPYGLYDMMGNVWQWTDGCREGDCSRLVLRGGSFEYEPEYMTLGYREGIEASERVNNLGFRVARTLQ